MTTYRWTGNAGDDRFDNPLNWEPNGVPATAEEAGMAPEGFPLGRMFDLYGVTKKQVPNTIQCELPVTSENQICLLLPDDCNYFTIEYKLDLTTSETQPDVRMRFARNATGYLTIKPGYNYTSPHSLTKQGIRLYFEADKPAYVTATLFHKTRGRKQKGILGLIGLVLQHCRLPASQRPQGASGPNPT